MKYLLSSAVIALALCNAYSAMADEITLVAPGGIRCTVDKVTADFEAKTGNKVKPTFGSGGVVHQKVLSGEPFDVEIIQPPYQDITDSGNIVASSATPLGTVGVFVIVRKGEPKPDISTPDAVKKLLLSAKAITYPDGNGGRGSATGVSFDETQKKLGIYEQVQPKVKRVQGTSWAKLLADGQVDVALMFGSESFNPDTQTVGILPASISTPTAFVGFLSPHAKAPEAAKALLTALSKAGDSYKTCLMEPSATGTR